MSGMLDNRYVRGAVVVLGGVLVMSFDAALIRAVDQRPGCVVVARCADMRCHGAGGSGLPRCWGEATLGQRVGCLG